MPSQRDITPIGPLPLNSFASWRLAVRGGVFIAAQEAQLSPSDRATRLVSSNLASCHATVQKLLIRQVLTKLTV